MNINNILFRIFAATALFWAVACEKPEMNSGAGDNPGQAETYSEINGTTINEKSTVIGLISDTSTGKGIPGVVVSDGYSVVKTDNNGVYQFAGNRNALYVFFSCPAEYEIPLDDATHKPLFYKVGLIKNGVNRNDFKLTPLKTNEENFTFIAVGDPQVSNASQINRYKNETISDIQTTISSNQSQGLYKNAYAITLGDIVNDTPDQWDGIVKTMHNVSLGNGIYLPFFQTIGNHDHNAKTETYEASIANFVNHYGPVDYSFNRGKVHVVVMDNVSLVSTDKSSWDYNGGFSKAQFNWLQKDLAAVDNKEDKMLILCCHIPFRSGGNNNTGSQMDADKYYKETLQLMSEWNEAHIMIGHTHYPQNYIHTAYKTKNGLPVYEHIHGGACGGWWACNLNVDGAPNGYSIYEVEGNHMKNWVAKSTNRAKDFQMRVYNGNQTYTGSKGYTYNWYSNSKGGSANISYTGRSFLKNCFVVSLWNDDDTNWTVDFIYNGVATPMTRAGQKVTDAAVVSYFFNECGKNTTSWTKPLYHYWYIQAPDGLDPSEVVGWTIKATQIIPGSNVKNEYTAGSLQTDYRGF